MATPSISFRFNSIQFNSVQYDLLFMLRLNAFHAIYLGEPFTLCNVQKKETCVYKCDCAFDIFVIKAREYWTLQFK